MTDKTDDEGFEAWLNFTFTKKAKDWLEYDDLTHYLKASYLAGESSGVACGEAKAKVRIRALVEKGFKELDDVVDNISMNWDENDGETYAKIKTKLLAALADDDKKD